MAGSGTATIALIKGVGAPVTIGTAPAKNNKFTYQVPPETVIGNDYVVRVTIGAVHDDSFEPFTMAA